jgi:hypothetical protein
MVRHALADAAASRNELLQAVALDRIDSETARATQLPSYSDIDIDGVF